MARYGPDLILLQLAKRAEAGGQTAARMADCESHDQTMGYRLTEWQRSDGEKKEDK